MKDKLFKILDVCETKQLAEIFKNYMESIGVRKFDGRRKDNSNTYCAHGDCTSWNRVECYYYKDKPEYGKSVLDITLRKRAGYYFLIGKDSQIAFERSYNYIAHYDEALLNEILQEHKPLFDALLKLVD
jgi:hypothetical protein